jgi:hypothetical protein
VPTEFRNFGNFGKMAFASAHPGGVMRKDEKLFELLNALKEKRFTGFIQINYSQGGITRVEKHEEILNGLVPPKVATQRGK